MDQETRLDQHSSVEGLPHCLNLHNGSSRDIVDHSYIGSIILDCKQLINSIDGCVIWYVCRASNRSAHTLAKADRARVGHTIWNVLPDFLASIFHNI